MSSLLYGFTHHITNCPHDDFFSVLCNSRSSLVSHWCIILDVEMPDLKTKIYPENLIAPEDDNCFVIYQGLIEIGKECCIVCF
jgi:hypothetical protein